MTVEAGSKISEGEIQFMRAALALARRSLGSAWPNPAVGCVLVRDERIIGRGWTQPGGRPHAETEALRRAGPASCGATAYISLEPCNHHGKTEPCTEALITAGIGRAVVAVEDPDPRVSGKGIQRLRSAGIAVTTGVCRDAAADLNAGFFLSVTRGRPSFTLKAATTLDGRIATRTGESRWITGPSARAAAHGLRADHDAILIGSGTALTDDPVLTCRLPGMWDRSPIRIIADGRLRLTPSTKLIETARQTPTWIVTALAPNPQRRRALEERGAIVIEVEGDACRHPAPGAVAEVLAKRGVTRVLIEGGSGIAASYLTAGLVDRLAWFRASQVIGSEGVPAVGALGIASLRDAPQFSRSGVTQVGEDVLETYRRRH